MENPEKLVT